VSTINLGEHQGDGIRYSMHLSAPAGGAAQMLRDPDGNWVGYAEYAALQAENERLRKAGDELARVASYILDTKVKAIEAWHAAKESRP
jgi:hypothetical protein